MPLLVIPPQECAASQFNDYFMMSTVNFPPTVAIVLSKQETVEVGRVGQKQLLAGNTSPGDGDFFCMPILK